MHLLNQKTSFQPRESNLNLRLLMKMYLLNQKLHFNPRIQHKLPFIIKNALA